MSELLVVGSEQDNTRLDRFLADQYEEYTRSFLQKLIDQGNVSINGISVKKSGIKLYFIKTNDIKYTQFKNEFQQNLSIIDVLMFNSKDEIMKLIKDYQLV